MKTTSPLPRGILAVLIISVVYIILYAAYTSVLLGGGTYAHHTPEQRHMHTQILAYALGVDADIGFLTPLEQDHMRDVRMVMTILRVFFAFALGVAVGVLGFSAWRLSEYILPLLLKTALWSGIVLLGLCAILGIAALFDFSAFWTGFHTIFFPQGNWQFARDSTLITLYPEWFYLWCTRQVVLRAGIVAIIVTGLGWWGLRATKRL